MATTSDPEEKTHCRPHFEILMKEQGTGKQHINTWVTKLLFLSAQRMVAVITIGFYFA